MTPLEAIHANAKWSSARSGRSVGLGDGFGYNRASVEWLEGYIERLRSSGKHEDSQAVENLTGVLGSFLGECVLQTYGGEWRDTDGRWGVYFDDRNAAFPFAKVMKQFQNDLEGGDSILGYFDSIGPVVLRRGNDAAR